jgi:hypothetical protein
VAVPVVSLSTALGVFTALLEVPDDEVSKLANASGSSERLSRKLCEVVEASSPTCVKYWSTVAVLTFAIACWPPVAVKHTATLTANVSANDAFLNVASLPNCALPAISLQRCLGSSTLGSHLDDPIVNIRFEYSLTNFVPALHKKLYQRLGSYHTSARCLPPALAPDFYTCNLSPAASRGLLLPTLYRCKKGGSHRTSDCW